MIRKTLTLFALCAAVALPAAAETDLDTILAKHVASRGGLEKIDAIETVRIEGRITMGPGMEAPITMEFRRPDSMRLEFEFQGMKAVQAYDGEKGWQVMPFAGITEPQEVTGPQLDVLVDQADFDGPLIHFDRSGDSVEYVGSEEVEGATMHKVKVTKANGDETLYYLDAEACLERKAETMADMGGMEVPVEVTYGDYKEVGGVTMAHSIRQAAQGAPMAQEIVFDTIAVNVEIGDDRFAMPAPAKAEPAGEEAPKEGE